MTSPQPPVDFSWTADLLARILAGIDWAVHQPVVMVILVIAAFISLIQYAMG
jgi:hypothetical protein